MLTSKKSRVNANIERVEAVRGEERRDDVSGTAREGASVESS